MKKNKFKSGQLLVYNFALKRDDGKVEEDMLFRDKPFTLDELKEVSEKHHCEIIATLYGSVRPFKDDIIKDNSFVVTLPKPVDIVDDVKRVDAIPVVENKIEKENNGKENIE